MPDLIPDIQQEVLEPHNLDGSINPKYPVDRRCKLGHIAPVGTRFFNVTSPSNTFPKELLGVYCEECIKQANMLVREMAEAGL